MRWIVIALFCAGCATAPTERGYRQHVAQECAWCGCKTELEVHHIIPQSTCKALGLTELIVDSRNLATFCDCAEHRCHLVIAHAGNYGFSNSQLAQMLKLKQEGGK